MAEWSAECERYSGIISRCYSPLPALS
jgi:hypothetical protein